MEAEIRSLKASLAYGWRSLKRLNELHKKQNVSTDEIDRVKTETRVAQHKLVQAEENKRLAELEELTEKEEIAAKASALSKYYRENYIRAPLWVQNVPFGVRKRVKYWEQPPGWVFAVLFEYLELED